MGHITICWVWRADGDRVSRRVAWTPVQLYKLDRTGPPASIAFGHGMAVTTLQLAQAYSVIASNGILRPLTFLKVDGDEVPGQRVMTQEIARTLRDMLETVVQPGGTGQRANVPFYRVAGKTGTAHKSSSEGYAEDRYLSLFTGFAPATNPRLVMAIIIDEPQSGEHYGGQVAAPVFSKVIQGALRILNIPRMICRN